MAFNTTRGWVTALTLTAIVAAPAAAQFGKALPKRAVPVTLSYLGVPLIQDELKLTEAQRDSVEEMIAAWRKLDAPFGKKDEDKKAGGIGELERRAIDLLSPQQKKRLLQVQIQLDHRRSGLITSFRDGRVVEELGLNEEQRAKLAVIEDEHFTQLETILLGAEPFEAIKTQVVRQKEKTVAQLAGLLTIEQRTKWKEDLIGPAFSAEVGPLPRPAASFGKSFVKVGSGGGVERSLTRTFLDYFEHKDMQKELGLSKEQVEKLIDFRADWTARSTQELRDAGPDTPAWHKALAKGHAEVNKGLGMILTPKQVARIKEVMAQHIAAHPAIRFGTIVNYPELVGPLKLTEEQKKKINTGTALSTLLTKEQRDAWKDLTGEPFKGTLPEGRFPGGFGKASSFTVTMPPLVDLAQTQPAQVELKVSAEQAKKVDDIVAGWTEAVRINAKLPAEVRDHAFQLADAAAEQGLAKVLTPKQWARLVQLERQHLWNTESLAALLGSAPIAKALGLTAAQRQKVRDVGEDSAQTGDLAKDELLARSTSLADRKSFDERQVKNFEDRLLALLNDAQKTQLDGLVGVRWRTATVAPKGKKGGPRD